MSKFAGFTPGPWHVVDNNPDDDHDSDMFGLEVQSRCRTKKGIVPIARIDSGFRDSFEREQRANAALIAAAPDLLRQRDAAVALLREARGRIRFGRRNCAKVCHLCHQDCKGLLARIGALLKEVER